MGWADVLENDGFTRRLRRVILKVGHFSVLPISRMMVYTSVSSLCRTKLTWVQLASETRVILVIDC